MEKTRNAALKPGSVIEYTDGSLDINDIKGILPHRYPFLLVDKIVEAVAQEKIVGIKNVTANEEFFNGHFPDNPIMPGVLMVEALAQTGGILMLNRKESIGRSAYFLGVDKVRFRKAVIPGDVLTLEVTVDKLKSRIAQLSGRAAVEGAVACEATILFAFA